MRVNHEHLAHEILRSRIGQLLINEAIREKKFKIPVHLAMGHEAIAVAAANAREPGDQFLLSHRNIHYQFAFGAHVRQLHDEYALLPSGLGEGKLGSMNLSNPKEGIIYTSSVLGNNLPVAAGVALATQVKGANTVTTVVTGDGAMEEGSFYETLLMLRSQNSSCIIFVENNEWSLATQIAERRCPIDVASITKGFDIPYVELSGNNVPQYIDVLSALRKEVLAKKCPAVVEIKLKSLGDWIMKTPDRPEGKYINYHAGLAPNAALNEWPEMREDTWDPVHVLGQGPNAGALKGWAKAQIAKMRGELA